MIAILDYEREALQFINESLGISDSCQNEANKMLNTLVQSWKTYGTKIASKPSYLTVWEGTINDFVCFDKQVPIKYRLFNFANKECYRSELNKGTLNNEECSFKFDTDTEDMWFELDVIAISGVIDKSQFIKNCCHEMFHCYTHIMGGRISPKRQSVYNMALDSIESFTKDPEGSNEVDNIIGICVYTIDPEEVKARCHELYAEFANKRKRKTPSSILEVIYNSEYYNTLKNIKYIFKEAFPTEEEYKEKSKFYNKLHIPYKKIRQEITNGIKNCEWEMGRTVTKIIDDFNLKQVPQNIFTWKDIKDPLTRLAATLRR